MQRRISYRENIVVLSLFVLCSAQVQAQDFWVTPNHGFQGETLTLKITASGSLFFDYPFDVQFNPNNGIEVGAISFDSGDNRYKTIKFNVTITIADNATLGERTVYVTDAIDYYTAAAIFEVLSATGGTITNVYPTSGMVGKSLDVTVTGSQTHFDKNTSVVSFSGSGITVDSVIDAQETVLTAHLSISASASPGKRSVTVTTGPEVATGSKLFEVTELPPVELSPPSGKQGDPISSLIITGGPGGYSSSTQVSLGEGISHGLVTASADGNTLTIYSITIDADTPVGPRDVVLGSPTFTTSNAFTVLVGDATKINSIDPVAADRGHPGFPVIVQGTHVRFDKVVGHLKLDGVTAYGINVETLSPIQLKADLHIGDDTTEGLHDVIVELCPAGGTSQDCQFVPPLIGAFDVTKPGAITVTDPNPATINAGVESTIALTVTDCPLVQGTTTMQIEPADGTTITALTVDSTQLTADINVDAAAFGSKRTLRVVTGPEVAIGTEIFKIFNPQIVRVAPTRAYQNTPSIKFTVYGNDLTFDSQSTISVSGDGVTVSNTVFDPLKSDQLSCSLAIAADAPVGKRDITVIAGTYTVTAAQAFSVISQSSSSPDSNGCSCSAAPDNPLWLAWGLLPLLILRWRRKRPVLVR